jgi:predicted MFS family arabinose efflux permease
MGMVGAITAAGTAIGAPFGRAIGRDFGWRNGILAFGGIVFLGALIFYFAYRVRPRQDSARTDRRPEKTQPATPSVMTKGSSVFRNPIVWALAVLEGIVGVGYFSSNWFIPGAVETIFGRKDMTASYIISTGFVVAICANIFFGYLMDRFNKWSVMGLMMVILIPASLCMNSTNLFLFWISSSIVLSVGLSAAQQCFSLAAELVPAREMGSVMGLVSLGPGIFGYVGPQMLGWLKDWTGGFTAGWYFLAIVAMISLSLVVYIKRYLKIRAAAV